MEMLSYSVSKDGNEDFCFVGTADADFLVNLSQLLAIERIHGMLHNPLEGCIRLVGIATHKMESESLQFVLKSRGAKVFQLFHTW